MRSLVFAVAAFLLLGPAPAFAQDATPGAQSQIQDQTQDQTTTTQSETAPASDTRADTATTAPPADANSAPAPAPQNPPMTGPQILIQTSMGDFKLQLDSVRAPKTVANVLRYVREGHYNGTAIYRVAKGFVIEMGSFDANGKGRPVHKGVPLEAGNGLSNLRGTVALAHGKKPDSGTADFFINLADNRALDKGQGDSGNLGFAVFGKVIQGMDVVDRIAQVPVGGGKGTMAGQEPLDPILIKRVSIVGVPDRPPRKARKKK